MTPGTNMGRPADILLSDEAIDWVVRLQSGSAGAADDLAFQQWRASSIDHELAAREAEAIWQGVGLVGPPLRAAEEKNRRSVTRRTLLGGSALTVAGLAVYASGGLRALFDDYTTGVGEQRVVEMADGSSVFLNSATSLSVDFSTSRRRLYLNEGQAVFNVAHDPLRPFIVSAGDGQTRAIGTVFDVDLQGPRVVVTVLEGTVAVSSPPHGNGLSLSVDYQAAYGSHGVEEARPVDADVATAWRRGKLVFNGRPLDSVINEIQRQRRVPILILNSEISALPLTGVFDLADPDAVLRAMAETLPVTVIEMPFVTLIR